MTDNEAPVEAPAAPAAPAAKATKTKKKSKSKSENNHPKYRDMIQTAISSLKERRGSSRQAIVKYISATYDVGDNPKIVNNSVKLALKAGVSRSALKQVSGTGASGSFRLVSASKPEKKTKSKKTVTKAKKATKPKSPKKAAKKTKKTTPKKAVKAKKSTPKKKVAKPKKSPAKKAKPAKAKKPAAKKAKAKKAKK